MKIAKPSIFFKTLALALSIYVLIFLLNVYKSNNLYSERRGLADLDIDLESSFKFNRIKLTKVSNVYLDVDKAAVFYANDAMLVLTFLTVVRSIKSPRQLNAGLVVKRDGAVVFSKIVNILEERPCETPHYIFSVFKKNMLKSICGENCNLSNVSLTYRLRIDDTYSDEYKINIVQQSNYDKNLTARLIKCMWMPKDMKTFDYVMQLMIEAKYDSIYICVMSKENELKQYFSKFDSKVQLIELDNIPHAYPGSPDFTHFKQLELDSRIDDKVGILDPVEEYLLNQMYPYLIAKYRYVHSGDFDHILFTKNQTFYKRIEEIAMKNKHPMSRSFYLKQYWGLNNEMSQEIFKDVVKAKTVPVDLNNKLGFKLRIENKDQLDYAMKIWSYLNSNSSSSEKKTMFRQVIFTFEHMNIFGQAVHNTKASMIIKLCGAYSNGFFTGGFQTKLDSPHFIHYRETYKFDTHLINGMYIPAKAFFLWSDLSSKEF